MDETRDYSGWAQTRRNRYAALFGGLLALAAALGTGALIDARSRAWFFGVGPAIVLLLGPALLVAFQRCPRCSKFWNVRGLIGFHTPYSPTCVNCGLEAPKPRVSKPALTAALVIVPAMLAALAIVAADALLPPPVHHRNVRVADAAWLHGRSDFVSFRDGVVRTDLLGTYAYNGRAPRSRPTAAYQVVPLVPEGWTADQPVRLWVLCAKGPQTGNCVDPARWIALLEREVRAGRPLRNGRVIPHGDVENEGTGWYYSTQDAEDRHGVSTHPEAIFIEWPADPDHE
jgi:hypothetical protein